MTPEQRKLYKQRFREKNPEKYRAQRSAERKRWRERYPEKHKAQQEAWLERSEAPSAVAEREYREGRGQRRQEMQGFRELASVRSPDAEGHLFTTEEAWRAWNLIALRARVRRGGEGEVSWQVTANKKGLDAQGDLAYTARLLGWKCLEFRPTWTPRGWRVAVCGSEAQGFVDLLMLRDSRLLLREVKAGRSDPRPEQERWIGDLRSAGVDAGLWRYEAIQEILEELRR